MNEQLLPDLNTRAELEKLARLIQSDSVDVSALAASGADNLRRLRQSINRRSFDEHREKFRALEKFTRVLPKNYLAKLAVSAFGPMLSGRLVGEMNPVRAAQIVRRLPADFLAKAVAQAEPDKVREIIALLPAGIIRDVAMILVGQGEYVLMGRFADALSAPAIRAVVGAVDDDSVLLHVAFYMEEKSQLTKVVHMIDNDRVARIMRTGTEKNLWPEALSIIDNVSPELRGRLANIMAEQDESILDGLVGVAHAQNLWGPVLRGMDKMNPKYYRKIVNLPAVKDAAVLGSLVNTAYEEGLLEAALPLAKSMRAAGHKVVAHATLQQGAEVAEAALWAAQNAGQWSVILDLAQHLNDAERDLIAGLAILRNKAPLTDLLSVAVAEKRVALLLDFVKRMSPAGKQTVAAVCLADEDLLEPVLDAARDEAAWDTVASVFGAAKAETLDKAVKVYQRLSDEDRAALTAAAKDQGVWDKLAASLESTAA